MHSKNDPLLLIKYINLKSFWMRINLNFMNENIDKKIVIKITIGPICKVHRHTSKTNTHTPKDFIEFWKKNKVAVARLSETLFQFPEHTMACSQPPVI